MIEQKKHRTDSIKEARTTTLEGIAPGFFYFLGFSL